MNLLWCVLCAWFGCLIGIVAMALAQIAARNPPTPDLRTQWQDAVHGSRRDTDISIG
jgi:hypothetical protein